MKVSMVSVITEHPDNSETLTGTVPYVAVTQPRTWTIYIPRLSRSFIFSAYEGAVIGGRAP